MLRIVTDTASDITVEQAAALQIELIQIETSFEDGVCPFNTEADFAAFYEKLKACKKLPVTSRPSPQEYLNIYQDAKRRGDDVLVITLSSGLSGTLESALLAQKMAEYDRITVIDSRLAVMAQRLLVEQAVRLRDAGETTARIAEQISGLRGQIRVIGVIDTLTYLQKGGRIPPALAFFGNALNIKPIITVENKVIQTVGKARGTKQGKAFAYSLMDRDGVDNSYPVYFGFTSERALGEQFMDETRGKYALDDCRLFPVNGVIGTHLGTNCFGLAYVARNPVDPGRDL